MVRTRGLVCLTGIFLCSSIAFAGSAPWFASSAIAVAAQTGSGDSASDRSALDALTWRGASSANTEQAYRAYLAEFPDGLFADLANEKLQSLAQSSSAPSAVPQPANITEGSSNSSGEAEQAAGSTEASDQGEASGGENLEASREVLSEEDRAYVPPPVAEPDLPELPPTPVLSQKDYPDCREDHQHIGAPFDKAAVINQCTVRLDKYYTDVLNGFRRQMIDHQNEISALYKDKVGGKPQYSRATQEKFYADVREEHAASNPDGENFAAHRAAEALYNVDRNYLRDRFCFNTGCAGYPVPKNPGKAPKSSGEGQGSSKSTKSAKKGGGKCKKSRGRGRLLGGIFGGLAGNAAGLGKIGTLAASGFGAILIGEIACQLDEKEQEQAAKATEEVAEKEEVGSVVEWKSPTRSGVSGSSTVTAANTRPNGNKCLSITDVAIVEGVETRVSKQMCRRPGDARYTIMA